MTRSRYTTFERLKKPIIYADFLTDFSKSPKSGILDMVTNEEAVKQALKNLVMTVRGERLYQPLLGSRMNTLLFEPMNGVTTGLLEQEIKDIASNEPRIRDIEPRVQAFEDMNGYSVTIFFRMINVPEQLSINFFLQRVR